MTKRVSPGMYAVGRVNEDSMSNRRGKYVVARGDKANERGHIEWQPINFLNKSKWYAIRVGPTERGTRHTNNVAHLMEEFDSKGGAVEYLRNRVDFDETF